MNNDVINLLVIDDDDVDRERIQHILCSSDISSNIQEACSATEAIRILDKNNFDCIILDYRLGETDGVTLLEEIINHQTRKTAIIMVTGLGDEEVAAHAMRLGASDYLNKNQLKPSEFIRAILNAVHRAKLENKLHDMAHYDDLTGLASRHLLLDRLQQVIANSSRSNTLSALAFIDLDNFKPVNDRYGHNAGDTVLIEIASRLKTLLRSSDTIARLGGDEFVLLINNLSSANECEDLLKRIIKILTKAIRISKSDSVSVSASIGVTLIDDTSIDADTFLRRADQTMYRVKNSGRNNILFFDKEEEKRQQKRREILESIENGLKNNEFTLYYQPKINLKTRCLVGLEALIRWQHPIHGLLAPEKFYEALNHSQLCIKIGEWVLKKALHNLSEWIKLGFPARVSVNISPAHLQKPNFSERLKALLSAYDNIPPGALELEVLETASINNMTETIGTLNRCRKLGVSIALDDFGTGYASLNYLKRLPLDTLKIDRGFVQNMLKNKDDRAIVASVIGLNSAFGYQLVAEGVETHKHEEALIKMGCTLGQGYSIARPMIAEKIPLWIVSRSRYIKQTQNQNNLRRNIQ